MQNNNNFNESSYRKKITLTFLVILLILSTGHKIILYSNYQDAMTWERIYQDKQKWLREYRMHAISRSWLHPIYPSDMDLDITEWLSSDDNDSMYVSNGRQYISFNTDNDAFYNYLENAAACSIYVYTVDPEDSDSVKIEINRYISK